MQNAQDLIAKLNLQQHPEGGWYKEIDRSSDLIQTQSQSQRNASTSIYFLLLGNERSHLHKIDAQEQWHYYAGTSPLLVHYIDQSQEIITSKIGNIGLMENTVPQTIVPKNSWFSAELEDKDGFALVGCTVAPGFEFSHFELDKNGALAKTFPQHAKFIEHFSLQTA